jgi:O-antigen/teichoic acid export membrane protein
MIGAAIAFGISMFLTTIYNRVDIMMLSVMKSPDVWGWYAAAHKLIDFTNVVPTVLMIATFPALARFSMSPGGLLNHLFTRGFKYLFLLTIPLVFSVIVLGDKMIGIVYGEEFVRAVPALRILACTAAILFINIFVSGLYGATNNQTRLVAFEVVGLVMNIAINYLLIPSLAHIGAALATLFTEIVVLTLLLSFAFTRVVRLSEKRFFVDALAAASIMAGLAYLCRECNVYLVFALCNCVYFLVLLGRKTVSLREILQLRRSEA